MVSREAQSRRQHMMRGGGVCSGVKTTVHSEAQFRRQHMMGGVWFCSASNTVVRRNALQVTGPDYDLVHRHRDVQSLARGAALIEC